MELTHPGTVGTDQRLRSKGLPEGLSLGVEEEFLLVDPVTWQVTPRAEAVVEAVPAHLRRFVQRELLATQVEIATPICHGLAELSDWLRRLRMSVAAAAERAGCRLVAAGTGLLKEAGVVPLTAGPRYAWIGEQFGALADVQGLCACHVHVGVSDRELAVQVSNHVRPWLPVLHAMTANSPYADGRETGYASWRSVLWARRPTTGPPPWLHSAEHFDRTVEDLVECGVMLDQRMLFWYARLSAVYPTVELRVGDVCLSADDTVLIAALSRALVRTAVRAVRAGRAAADVDDQMLSAAHWRAARFGLEGPGFDVAARRLRPSWDLVRALLEHVRPVLEEDGDLSTVRKLCAGLKKAGSGAHRQRVALAAGKDLRSVVQYLVGETVGSVCDDIGDGDVEHASQRARLTADETLRDVLAMREYL